MYMTYNKTAGAHYYSCLHLVWNVVIRLKLFTHSNGSFQDKGINHHGAVGKSSSEQQFDAITLAVLNFWSCTPSSTMSYVRQAGLADKVQVIFEIFKIHYRLNYIINFSLCLTNVQHYYSSTIGFFS